MDYAAVVAGLSAGKDSLLFQYNELGAWSTQEQLACHRQSQDSPADNNHITTPRFRLAARSRLEAFHLFVDLVPEKTALRFGYWRSSLTFSIVDPCVRA
jgi:hypothetical protein